MESGLLVEPTGRASKDRIHTETETIKDLVVRKLIDHPPNSKALVIELYYERGFCHSVFLLSGAVS
jgi:hypothetical protein